MSMTAVTIVSGSPFYRGPQEVREYRWIWTFTQSGGVLGLARVRQYRTLSVIRAEWTCSVDRTAIPDVPASAQAALAAEGYTLISQEVIPGDQTRPLSTGTVRGVYVEEWEKEIASWTLG